MGEEEDLGITVEYHASLYASEEYTQVTSVQYLWKYIAGSKVRSSFLSWDLHDLQLVSGADLSLQKEKEAQTKNPECIFTLLES